MSTPSEVRPALLQGVQVGEKTMIVTLGLANAIIAVVWA